MNGLPVSLACADKECRATLDQFIGMLPGLHREKAGKTSGAAVLSVDMDGEGEAVVVCAPGTRDRTLKKPVRLAQLAAMMADMQRLPASEPAYPLGSELTFDASTRDLIHGASGQQVTLTEKEAALLQALLVAGEGGVTRQELLERVWGYQASIATNTLETHVWRLRGKLESLFAPTCSPVLIAGEQGLYRLSVSKS